MCIFSPYDIASLRTPSIGQEAVQAGGPEVYMYSYSLSLPWASVFHFCAYFIYSSLIIIFEFDSSFSLLIHVYIYIYIYIHIYLIPMLWDRVSSRVETILHSRRLQFRKGGRHESNTYNLSLQALVSESHSVVSDSLWSHGLWPPRLLCPWEFSWQAY